MKVIDVIQPDLIRLDSMSRTKKEIIEEIAELAVTSDTLKGISEAAVRKALDDREKLAATAFGNEIAIPHCFFSTIDTFVVGLIVNKKGVEFGSSGGEKTKLFFFIIGPQQARSRHIRLLSSLSRLLKEKTVRTGLLQANSYTDVKSVLSSETDVSSEQEVTEKCMFNVHIQREDLFDEILQIFTGIDNCSVSVLEASDASRYLHRMPLFASLWNQDRSGFHRLLLAVTEKSRCNDLIRRINLLSDHIEEQPGVLVTVYDLMYAGGSVEL